ncbi:alpha/beta fold hydrolase [Pseudomonas cremoricolorata]|uniref:alpha/beta fold hydrolase n=1 Tax=Pseudomonas cremoricolorata TaxID=157783 RepID=UPI0006768FCD|nr:alpha/beta fold hydrolase [Pseudomonas cremoricolorata]
MTSPEKIVFLPGASGNTHFWEPVADHLNTPIARQHLGWPGFGQTPANPDITCLEDLAQGVIAQLEGPVALIAQSMGGVVAVHIALSRPELVTHLILSVTSGGLDLSGFGAADWRTELEAEQPDVPRWFLDDRTDLSERLHQLQLPVLLLWGGADPISPVAVGEQLAQLLPDARLHVFPQAGHDLGLRHAAAVAKLIDEHLGDCARTAHPAPRLTNP